MRPLSLLLYDRLLSGTQSRCKGDSDDDVGETSKTVNFSLVVHAEKNIRNMIMQEKRPILFVLVMKNPPNNPIHK